MQILAAEHEHLEMLVPLFDGYRQFFGYSADLTLARDFLEERLSKGEAMFFLAFLKDTACGFTTLYPSFSSLAAQKLLILNDLYVSPDYRANGVGRRLLMAASRHASENGYRGLKLETQENNLIGQKLYEGVGYVRQTGFYQYFLSTPPRKGVLRRILGF